MHSLRHTPLNKKHGRLNHSLGSYPRSGVHGRPYRFSHSASAYPGRRRQVSVAWGEKRKRDSQAVPPRPAAASCQRPGRVVFPPASHRSARCPEPDVLRLPHERPQPRRHRRHRFWISAGHDPFLPTEPLHSLGHRARHLLVVLRCLPRVEGKLLIAKLKGTILLRVAYL